MQKMPKVADWERLKEYEKDSSAVNDRELACTGSASCELVDITSEEKT